MVGNSVCTSWLKGDASLASGETLRISESRRIPQCKPGIGKVTGTVPEIAELVAGTVPKETTCGQSEKNFSQFPVILSSDVADVDIQSFKLLIIIDLLHYDDPVWGEPVWQQSCSQQAWCSRIPAFIRV
jgi:hypothetical protein